MNQSLLRSNKNRVVIIETYFYCLEIGPTIGQSNELIANMINRIGINVLVFPERDYQSPLTRINRREYPTVKPINASFTGVCLSFDLENSPICTSISKKHISLCSYIICEDYSGTVHNGDRKISHFLKMLQRCSFLK